MILNGRDDMYMKKSILLLILCLCFLVIMCAACANKEQNVVLEGQALADAEEEFAEHRYDFPINEGHYIIDNERLGLSLAIPVQQMDDMTIYSGQFYLLDGPVGMNPLDGLQAIYFPPGLLEEVAAMLTDSNSEEIMNEALQMMYDRSRLLCGIQYYSAGIWDTWISEGKSIVDITGNTQNIELGRQNGRVYIYTEPAPSEDGLTEEELPAYRLAVASLPAMRNLASMLEQDTIISKNTLPTFSTLDIYGEAVDNSIFANYELTMLNIWGTFCGPCIMEMPDLGEMAADMPDGTQLVGLVGDALNKEYIELAQEIAENTGAAYPHIVPDKALYDYLNRYIAAYPTTIFVDSRGNTVGEPIVGVLSRAKYEETLIQRLKTQEANE